MKIKTTRTITFGTKLEAVKWLVNYYRNPKTSVGLQKSQNGSQENPYYSCYYITPDDDSEACSLGGHCVIGAILSYAGVTPEDMREEGLSNSTNANDVVKKLNIDVEEMPTGSNDDRSDDKNFSFWGILQQIHDSIAGVGALDGRLLANVLDHNSELLSSGTYKEREELAINLRHMLQGRIVEQI